MSTHTFLLAPGRWTAQGSYSDAGGAATPAHGETVVRHEERNWILEGTLSLPEQGREFSTAYAVRPLAPGRDWTTFTCRNPNLGVLTGYITLAGNCLLSCFTAAGGLQGMESLMMLDARTYESRGALCSATEKIGSWTMLLTAVQP